MAQIRITPEELRNGADFLEQKLEAINAEVAALKGKIDEVTGNWEGAAQSSFVETFENDMYPILKDTLPEVITGIVAQMDGAADAIEQTDAEVAKAFRRIIRDCNLEVLDKVHRDNAANLTNFSNHSLRNTFTSICYGNVL